ncbi:methylmalonyl Co-A mutase-associated GTPase MeaB [Rhodocytophaga rosea]|uniref:Methylmalonyl Co-A mutase-associated GTPase MeaB n=1 Tax=Rhodocytophaga rosea TaxID=2704465 RepID=A0A6C0GKE8_9BACT|nr:methylmalonyl Co-A mutase-associated GTPase MeaB [Rhodocytophaga rosea]QHT68551.1 methylmalonyl Co-A mutase-associated GTPase MeaB [Rhodocytophaga rosea]
MSTRNNRLPAETYAAGILAGDRLLLSRAITLSESTLPSDQELSQEVLQQVLPHTGKSIRIGITGVPGVGKSSFIEVFGNYITSLPKKLAVLAIDPTSQISGGSIMGDKTRMETLSNHPLAFIRPSPAGNALGGVATHTRQALILCEAAGYEVIIIETVGVGQSETAVYHMTDFFLLLMLANAGDELQGMKRGIMEMADALVITKADGDNLNAAQTARVTYENALHLFPPSAKQWQPQALTCSAFTKAGIPEIWALVEKFYQHMQGKGLFDLHRQNQNLYWMHEIIKQTLEKQFYENTDVKRLLPNLQIDVQSGKITALSAALQLLNSLQKK